jgi:lipopolysaccharide transport system permease protein
MEPLRTVWRYRWPVWIVFRKYLKAPFTGSIFGRLWNIVLPLVPVGAYLFLRLMLAPGDSGADIHPAVYVAVGVTMWYVLSDLLLTTLASIKRSRTELAETSFPILGAVLASYGTIIFDTMVRVIALLPVVLLLEGAPSIGALWFLPVLLLGICFASAVGLILLSLSFVFPDIEHILSVLMRYLIFVSLVIFPIPTDSGIWNTLLMLNPFAFFVDAMRNALVHGEVQFDLVFGAYTVVTLALLAFALHLLAALQKPIRSLI